jgi:hypothetical protein
VGKQKLPKPPDAKDTAAQQTKSNIDTAVAQTNLNNVDQTTPFGSLSYDIIGTNPDGTPKYRATQSFSDPVKGVVDNSLNAVKDPLDLSAANLDKYTNSHFLDDFNGQADRDLTNLTTRLSNQGIKEGSEAFKNAMADYSRNKGNAFDNFLGNQQSSALNMLTTQRNSALNDMSAVTGQATQRLPTAQTGVAGTDIAGLINKQYDTQLNAAQQANSDTLGGLFGLGKAALGMFKFSDERLKEDIEPTGEKVAGVPVKEWTWKATGERDVGVIAQEVEKKHPELVDQSHPSGFRRVNYPALMAKAVSEYKRAA